MKTEKNILIAFILNLTFSIFEFMGGISSGSVAIISDAFHDFSDALSIGLSFLFEKKSKQSPDDKYTYGYTRYSVLGSIITSLFLTAGSMFVILSAVKRILNPVKINYNEMIFFSVIGIIINSLAVYFTHEKGSLNQRAVKLHMLEDVFGWITVLFGAFVMKLTDITVFDSLISIALSLFILINAIKNIKEAVTIFLEKAPCGTNPDSIAEQIKEIDGVIEVHHIHLWQLDEKNNCATMHIVTDFPSREIKSKIKALLKQNKINHSVLEIEEPYEKYTEKIYGADQCTTES